MEKLNILEKSILDVVKTTVKNLTPIEVVSGNVLKYVGTTPIGKRIWMTIAKSSNIISISWSDGIHRGEDIGGTFTVEDAEIAKIYEDTIKSGIIGPCNLNAYNYLFNDYNKSITTIVDQ